MTRGQLSLRKFPGPPFSGEVRLAASGGEPRLQPAARLCAVHRQTFPLPPRPDTTILSDSIPLFFIGRNHNGFWVARGADGRSGGLFLQKRSALRFARKVSRPGGCATIVLAEPLELDVANRGGFFATRLAAAIGAAARGTPIPGAFVVMIIVQWRRLVNQISRAFAGERRNRERIEREPFHGQ
jgi:hypothetical protein